MQKNTNPFMKAGTEAFDVLGTGRSIAAPRNATHHSQRQLSNSGLSSREAPNPFSASNSRTPSVYSSHGGALAAVNGAALAASYDEEKKHILPLPIEDPNKFLPDELKQPHVALQDLYALPDKSSGKDRKLGDGASASVRVVQHKATHKYFALKKFLLLPKEQPDHFYERSSKEFRIAKQLSGSAHIVDTYAVLKVPTTTTLNRGWGFILDYCKGGDLFSLITRTGFKSSPHAEKLCLFKQIVYGVKFMHDNGIVHRDLKPENVLLTDQGVCKITDFGVADYAHEDPHDLTSPVKPGTGFVGSPPYVPPEVHAVEDGPVKTYDPFAPDLWALGVILFCIFYQNVPFQKALGSDGNFREYRQAVERFTSSNPVFKHKDCTIGPGPEFKFAKEFQSSHTARLAWKLAEIKPEHRYTMDDLISDNAFTSIECCVDEDSLEHHTQYWALCDTLMQLPEGAESYEETNQKGSPLSRPSRSMLDFTSIPPEQLGAPALAPPTKPLAINSSTDHPASASGSMVTPPSSAVLPNINGTSATPPSPGTVVKESSSLPTLSEDPESVGTSPTTTTAMNSLSLNINTRPENNDLSSQQHTPSTDSLLNFSPRASFGVGSSPPKSIAEEANERTVGPVPNRAASFSSVNSHFSVRSGGSNGGRCKHHHLDVSNMQMRSAPLKR